LIPIFRKLRRFKEFPAAWWCGRDKGGDDCPAMKSLQRRSGQPRARTSATADTGASGRLLGHGQGLDGPVEPVAARALDPGGFQRPVGGSDGVSCVHLGWEPAPDGFVVL